MDPRSPGNRTKAAKFRRALERGQKLEAIDQLWLDEYEASQKKSNGAPRHAVNGAKDYGRSRSARTLEFKLQEAAEAEGTGSAAAAALAAREEGRRIDSLSIASTGTLREACEVYKDVCLTLKENFEILSNAVVESMMSARAHYLAAGQMEAALIRAQNEQHSDPATEMITLLVGKHLGLAPEELGGVRAAVAAAQQQQEKAPPNGASK